MIDDAGPIACVTEDYPSDAEPITGWNAIRRAWVSGLAVLACVVIFIGLAVQNDYESWRAISRWGYLPPESIWRGAYWGLFTPAFVHFAFWHLAFNAYWLWVLGSRMERAIGSVRFLAFVLAAAFVSSSFQLALTDSTGIGASGVVYAIFGFMWPARRRILVFHEVLDQRTINIFVAWLFGCVVVTYLGIWQIGNAAHITGLIFGAAIAGSFVVGFKPRLVQVGTCLLVLGAIVPLFWCPWSETWLSIRAYDAHAASRYQEAIGYYSQLLKMNPENSWALQNRGAAYGALGDDVNARRDLERAQSISPAGDADD